MGRAHPKFPCRSSQVTWLPVKMPGRCTLLRKDGSCRCTLYNQFSVKKKKILPSNSIVRKESYKMICTL